MHDIFQFFLHFNFLSSIIFQPGSRGHCVFTSKFKLSAEKKKKKKNMQEVSLFNFPFFTRTFIYCQLQRLFSGKDLFPHSSFLSL